MSQVTKLADHWKKSLTYTEKGAIDKIRCNAVLLIANGPFAGMIGRNDFSGKMFWIKTPPDDMPGCIAPVKGEEFNEDHHVNYVQQWLVKTYGVRFPDEKVASACAIASYHSRFHPLRDWLSSLRWDGVSRLDTLLQDRFGVTPSRYASKTMAWWMMSAVARIYEPGIKADCMIILQGAQGARKSSALSLLCGDEYFLDHVPSIEGKDAAIAIQGKWIVEECELEAMTKSDERTFKSFVSRRTDDYRPPYGKTNVQRPRTVVFAGTSNSDKLFSDISGSRRYWPYFCAVTGPIDLHAIRENRDQIWAEAVARYNGGEQWYPSEDMLDEIMAQQEERFDADVWEPRIAKQVDDWEDHSTKTDFTVGELLEAFGVPPAQQNRAMAMRVGGTLIRMGYKQTGRRNIGGKRYRTYEMKRRLIREPGEDDQ
jgi:predicted P-loop ATPase